MLRLQLAFRTKATSDCALGDLIKGFLGPTSGTGATKAGVWVRWDRG